MKTKHTFYNPCNKTTKTSKRILTKIPYRLNTNKIKQKTANQKTIKQEEVQPCVREPNPNPNP